MVGIINRELGLDYSTDILPVELFSPDKKKLNKNNLNDFLNSISSSYEKITNTSLEFKEYFLSTPSQSYSSSYIFAQENLIKKGLKKISDYISSFENLPPFPSSVERDIFWKDIDNKNNNIKNILAFCANMYEKISIDEKRPVLFFRVNNKHITPNFLFEDEKAIFKNKNSISRQPIHSIDINFSSATIQDFLFSPDCDVKTRVLTPKLLIGGAGSGKTTALIMKILMLSLSQPTYNNCKQSKGLVLRGLQTDLQSSIIPTFEKWFPPEIFGSVLKNNNTPFLSLHFYDASFTKVDIDIYFDGSPPVSKAQAYFGSKEFTWVLINEASEIPADIVFLALSRCRYNPIPIKEYNSPVNLKLPSYGLFLDTNPCRKMDIKTGSNSWIYDAVIQNKESTPNSKYKIFKIYEQQAKENAENLPKGYHETLENLPDEYKKTLLLSTFSNATEGDSVYSGFFFPEKHLDEDLLYRFYSPNRPLIVGIDFGIKSASIVYGQKFNEKWYIYGEVVSDGSAFLTKDFVTYAMNIICSRLQKTGFYNSYMFLDNSNYLPYPLFICDPSGLNASANGVAHIEQIIKLGYEAIPYPDKSNDIDNRLHNVRMVLQLNEILIDKKACPKLVEGFIDGYFYKKDKYNQYKLKPEKNSYSHVHDALQYFIFYVNDSMNNDSFLQKYVYRDITEKASLLYSKQKTYKKKERYFPNVSISRLFAFK